MNAKRFVVLLLLLGLKSSVAYSAEKIVPYRQFGEFKHVGTARYEYIVRDLTALAKATDPGIYPNQDLLTDERYQTFLKEARRPIDPWAYAADPAREVFAWTAAENVDPGKRAYFIAEAYRKAGLYEQAIKAYYTVLIHFPKTAVWSADESYYWYASPEALARIRKLCALHPELGISLEGAFVDIIRSGKVDPSTDEVRVWPGEFKNSAPVALPTLDRKITKERGKGHVRLVQYNNRDWELLKDGKPFFIRGITYTCTTIGESAHALNLRPWMSLDDNYNGKNDGMFDSWVDQNLNNRQDADELAIGDAQLLKQMGLNAIRVYHGVDGSGDYSNSAYDKDLMRALAKDYGIYFILGDFLGAYTLGSKANWSEGTDYTDPVQRQSMLECVKAMVLDHKDEPYVLCWLLGNENNNPGTHTNASSQMEAYARLVNEAALMIHRLDPNHPVAVCDFHTLGLRTFAEYASEVDIYGANIYAGEYSFGSLWQLTKKYYDRPVMITEMGCPAYFRGRGPDEDGQASYLVSNWQDIALNAAGQRGEGNAVGGIVFEWMDEWWKSSKGNAWGDPETHNTDGDYQGPFPGGWMHEEWLGIVGQGNGMQSHQLRQPRKAYFALKDLWVKDQKP